MGALRGLLARAGHARDGIGHHGGSSVHEARTDGGRRSERGGRRVAARAAHEHGLAGSTTGGRGSQLVAGQLGQPEGGLGQKVGGGVGRVPFLVDSRILQAEIGRQVDDRDTGGDKVGRHAHGRLVGHRQKHHVEGREISILVGGEREIGYPSEGGIGLRNGRSRQRVGGRRRQVELGVARQQAHQLDAGETGRSHNSRSIAHRIFLPLCPFIYSALS